MFYPFTMRFASLVTFISLFISQCTANDMCLTPEPPAKLVAAHNMLKDQENTPKARLMLRDNPPRLDIDLYFHVVESEEKKGEIKSDAIQQQVKTIVDIYSQYNILFHYKGVDYTVNDEWGTTMNDSVSRGVALRKGDYLALNIYIVTSLGVPALGICTFPRNSDKIPGVASEDGDDEESDDGTDFLPKDGCTIGGFTLPGQQYDGEAMEGLTAIHEIGHWLGLFHTFQGNDCDGPGDLVQDTRVQMNETRGCPEHRVSCPNALFPPTPDDPFHNFMDYSSDNCTNQFTPLQLVRVFGVFPLFRVSENTNASTPGNYTVSPSGYFNSSIATLPTTSFRIGPQPIVTSFLGQAKSTGAAAPSAASIPIQPTPLPNLAGFHTDDIDASIYIAGDLGTCVAAVVTMTTLSC